MCYKKKVRKVNKPKYFSNLGIHAHPRSLACLKFESMQVPMRLQLPPRHHSDPSLSGPSAVHGANGWCYQNLTQARGGVTKISPKPGRNRPGHESQKEREKTPPYGAAAPTSLPWLELRWGKNLYLTIPVKKRVKIVKRCKKIGWNHVV